MEDTIQCPERLRSPEGSRGVSQGFGPARGARVGLVCDKECPAHVALTVNGDHGERHRPGGCGRPERRSSRQRLPRRDNWHNRGPGCTLRKNTRGGRGCGLGRNVPERLAWATADPGGWHPTGRGDYQGPRGWEITGPLEWRRGTPCTGAWLRAIERRGAGLKEAANLRGSPAEEDPRRQQMARQGPGPRAPPNEQGDLGHSYGPSEPERSTRAATDPGDQLLQWRGAYWGPGEWETTGTPELKSQA
ncbi:hypothetical protein NDU88_004295 [Pleurodeles waltl]|uniref:Uncharacterized protein n=1 Tax=Pleurodeles waltl TaxID=8319 RepID=A0AAV7UEY4_PLEWA|nr:hypothetical protein NDU88_004295 [Pleurodeles waltl]